MIQATKFFLDAIGNWRIILNDLGINANELLRLSQLPGDLFSRKNPSLTTEEYFRLWNSIDQLMDDPSFPLRLGEIMSPESFSPLFFAALCSPNLNVAMTRVSHYKRLVGPMTIHVEEEVETTTVSLDYLNTDKPFPATLIAAEFVFLVHLVRLATREQIKPLSVSAKLLFTNKKDYAAYFGVTPTIGEKNQLQFSAIDANRPFLTENKEMWRFFEPELSKRLTEIEADATFSSRVRSSLLELLPSGLCSADDVAKKLAVSKRTLQRLLKNENTTFQQELNQTRESLARHYLANSTFTGAQISFLLGFDDPNSFFRAFRSWTGATPESVRAEMMH